MPMRLSLPLVALIVLNACGGFGQRGPGGPEPATYQLVIPAGALVRAHPLEGSAVRGLLMMPFRPESREVVICETGHEPCAALTAPGVHTLPVLSLRELEVWRKQDRYLATLGIYSGALAGLLAEGDEGGGLLLALGGAAGGALGYAIGSRVKGWSPLLRCHHACGWSDEPVPAPAAAP